MRWALLICGKQDSKKEIHKTLLMLTPAIILGLLKIGLSNDSGVRLVQEGKADAVEAECSDLLLAPPLVFYSSCLLAVCSLLLFRSLPQSLILQR